jgi:hypothetical protein
MSEMKLDKIKRDRFVRSAEKRTQNVLLALKRLSNCSNISYYQFFDFDIEKIFAEIKSKVETTETMFETNLVRQVRGKFKL